MKKRLSGLCAAVLCALTLASAIQPARGAAVYFMAVNDTLMELSADTMPATVNRTLYVPYTMLSARVSGVNLGVYATYRSTTSQALVYSPTKQLIFEISARQTYDGDGANYSEQAIMRNSMVYLPIALICQVFEELDYTLSSTEYGYLVRLTNRSAVLGDDAFINAAASMMSGALARYRLEHPEDNSSTDDRPGGVGSGAGVYPAFLQTGAGALSAAADALESRDCRGLFLLTARQLAEEGELVRRLVGMGHMVGIYLNEDSREARRAALEAGQAALARAAHCRLGIGLVEQPEEGELAELEGQGLVCWRTTVDGRAAQGSTASRRAQAMMRQMKTGEGVRNYLLLDDAAVDELDTVLSAITRAGYQLRIPVATQL